MGPGMRRFVLERNTDHSGFSGVGVITQGVVFSDGTVVMKWLGRFPTVTVFGSVYELEAIHGHGGATVIVWLDPRPSDAEPYGAKTETTP